MSLGLGLALNPHDGRGQGQGQGSNNSPGAVVTPVVGGHTNSLYAGIAQTGIRALALYFSRPVRLFRPSKAR